MNTRESVKNYYGKILTNTSDLKTDCCKTATSPSPEITDLLANIHDDVTQRYFGCGLIHPDKLEGMSARSWLWQWQGRVHAQPTGWS